MRKDPLILKAENTGRVAFLARKPRDPSLDPALGRLLEGLMQGEGKPVIEAWRRGWLDASTFKQSV